MASASGPVLACSLFDSLMFALIVYGIGVVLVLACCSFDLVRSVDLFVLVINGIGARWVLACSSFDVVGVRRPHLPLVASALRADVLFG